MDDIDIDIEGEEARLLDEVPVATASDGTPGSTALTGNSGLYQDAEALNMAYPEPDWLTTEHLLQSDNLDAQEMDPQSKALIESMFAEEAHYFGHASYVGDPLVYSSNATIGKGQENRSNSTKPAIRRSRWTEEENKALVEGVEKYGYGSWRKVAAHIGNRTSKQVVVHTRHLLLQGVPIAGAPSIEVPRLAASLLKGGGGNSNKTGATVNNELQPLNVKRDQVDEDIDVDITDGSDVEAVPMFHCIDPHTELSDDSELEDSGSSLNSLREEGTLESSEFSNTTYEGDANSDLKSAECQDEEGGLSKPEITTYEEDSKENSTLPVADHAEIRILPDSGIPSPIRKTLTPDLSDLPLNLKIEPDVANSEGCIQEDSKVIQHREEQECSGIEPDSAEAARDNDHVTCDSDTGLENFTIDPSTIKSFEMEFCPEWFLGVYTGKRANKTPSRYQKIRNHILDLWIDIKPVSVSKSRIRPGLKGEGDVNAISRVHSFLESIGAINVDCKKLTSKVKQSIPRSSSSETKYVGDKNSYGTDISEIVEETQNVSTDYNSRRRRKVRTANGDWIWELEGTTIEHLDPEKEEQRKLLQKNAKYFADEELEKLNIKRPKTSKVAITDVMGKYDPFKLIPLQRYAEDSVHALRVKVHSNALIIMDFHSHLAHTEIIGLIGGTFDPIKRELCMLQIFPCNSLSTGIQCEMDPVSEMNAREHFSHQNLCVVGWYHSHPTFEPNPSIRDIENQANYQNLFRRDDGMEPFVGVIVSPFDSRTPVLVSRFQFITVSQEWNSMSEYRLPYSCLKSIIPSESIPPELFVQISELVRTYRIHHSLVDLSRPFQTRFTTTTRLRKLMSSLESHVILGASQAQTKLFLDKVQDLVQRGFSMSLEKVDQVASGSQ
ncbi:hypothetical protein BASA62_008719 [Batrachochytrium salamandrivorans]|nr:hypothetical protein BASA62_008719 [Batrachochytrium salamandrivorans]